MLCSFERPAEVYLIASSYKLIAGRRMVGSGAVLPMVGGRGRHIVIPLFSPRIII